MMTCQICKGIRRSRTAGFTLMEMLLVISILVIAAAVVWPTMHGPMADQQLRKCGDLIRAQWGRTRVEAMKTGRIHVFRYETGGDGYLSEPWQGDLTAGDATDSLTVGENSQAGASQFVSEDSQREQNRLPRNGIGGRRRLPSGITFSGGQTTDDARSAQVDETTTVAAQAGVWARPIVFYPDGSTTDARVVLTNERCFVEVRLRGLTGFSQTSDLLSQNELTP